MPIVLARFADADCPVAIDIIGTVFRDAMSTLRLPYMLLQSHRTTAPEWIGC
jgi:hypothetical protein